MTTGAEQVLDGFVEALLEDDAERLYDQAPCGYLSTDPDGRVLKANQTFLTLSGYPLDQVLGRRFADLLSPGGRIYHETHFAPLLRMHGTATEIALEIVRPDGSRLPVLVNAVLERDEHGSPLVIRTAVFDATHRRAYERELLRAKHQAEESEARAQALARTLQQTLIPPTPPHVPHLDVAARYRPAGDGSEVGGDFYDVFQVGTDDWVVVIGDVCGKGAEAAVVTALARYALRAAVVERSSPAAALRMLNEVLLKQGGERFCTVALLRLRRRDPGWELVLCAAGHPLPLLRAAGGDVRTVGEPGPLLGVLPEPELHDARLELAPRDLLLLHTDGVTEARADARFYGDEPLRALLAGHGGGADGLVETVLAEVLAFQAGAARDDIALVALGVPEAGDEPSPERAVS